jgi:hypothetical protein
MSHTLTIEVSDAVYEPLQKTAAQSGQSPEALVTQWISIAVQRLAEDPLEQFIGTLSSQRPDWADHHDQYLGKAVADTMQTTAPETTSDG